MNFCPIFDHSTTKNAHSMFRSSTSHLSFHPKSLSFPPILLLFHSPETAPLFLPSFSL